MVIEVHNGDKDFCKAVFSISVFGFHIKVKLGFDLSIQTGPGLSVDDSRIRLNKKPAEKYKTGNEFYRENRDYTELVVQGDVNMM